MRLELKRQFPHARFAGQASQLWRRSQADRLGPMHYVRCLARRLRLQLTTVQDPVASRYLRAQTLASVHLARLEGLA